MFFISLWTFENVFYGPHTGEMRTIETYVIGMSERETTYGLNRRHPNEHS